MNAQLVYNAALRPQLWGEVLQRLVGLVGAESAVLSRLDIQDGTGQAVTAVDNPDLLQEFLDYYCLINPVQIVADPDSYLRGWRPACWWTRIGYPGIRSSDLNSTMTS